MRHQTQLTSRKAYLDEIAPSLGARQIKVMEMLDRLGEATNSELAEALEWKINTITPRVLEVRNKGLVVEAKKRVCKITGRVAIAWMLTGSKPLIIEVISKKEFHSAPSTTKPDVIHRQWRVNGALYCTCPGFSWTYKCRHIRELTEQTQLQENNLDI